MTNILFNLYDSFSKNQMRDSWCYRSFNYGQKQIIVCECPGIRHEDIRITLEQHENSLISLRVKGASKISIKSDDAEDCKECNYSREIDFKVPVDTPYIEKVEWKYYDGILKIEVFKKEFDINQIEIKKA